jgi:hypothetical protein
MASTSGGIGSKEPCPSCNPEAKSELEMTQRAYAQPCKRCGGTGFISRLDGWKDDDLKSR